MFDIGWPELMVSCVLALIVVGPKELPRVLRTVMGVVRKVRMMAGEFQSTMEDVAREADLADIKKEMERAKGDGLKEQLTDHVTSVVDPDGSFSSSMSEMEKDVKEAHQNSKMENSKSEKPEINAPS